MQRRYPHPGGSIRLDNLLAMHGHPDQVLLVPPPSASAPTPMEIRGAAARAIGGASSLTRCGQRGHTDDRCWRSSSGSRDGRPSIVRTP